ncbi:hypothetical protein B0O99DRAFT_637482 [Bisporella sp. PMI_857]|nr:hypothetical protein B0O99DRAFT_637482 [Bisporella sp. PMI_857]
MTSADGISMFGSNFGLQPASSQPRLDNFEDYSFTFGAANAPTLCSHRELQEVLDRGDLAATMTNISKGHAQQTPVPPTSISSSYHTDIESLKKYAPSGFNLADTDQTRDVIELKRESEPRGKKVEKLHEMFVSLVNTVAKQGVAVKQMIEDMSPERSESFFRGFKEELHKIPTNPSSKA